MTPLTVRIPISEPQDQTRPGSSQNLGTESANPRIQQHHIITSQIASNRIKSAGHERIGWRRGGALTGLLLLAVRPLGDGEVNLLAGRGLGLEGLLEAVPHQRGADVGVADVGHPRRAPEGHRRRRRRHRVASLPCAAAGG